MELEEMILAYLSEMECPFLVEMKGGKDADENEDKDAYGE
jgi:hypothetical protein